MLVRKQDAVEKSISEHLVVCEYVVPSSKIGLATARINGRYPGEGMVFNEACDETHFVISGQGIVHQETGDYIIRPGDAILFKSGKWYWIEGTDLYVVVGTSPPWNAKQHKQIS